MKYSKIVWAWWIGAFLVVAWGVRPGMAQSDTQPAAEPQVSAPEIPDMGELSEEQAAILADALQRIQMLRDRQRGDQRRAAEAAAEMEREAARAHAEASQAQQADDEARKSFEEAIEERADRLAEAVEAWADKFGAEAEDWADSFAEDMEAWAEDYSADWEQWAEQHGEQWEKWADEFSSKWETWGDKLANSEVSKEEMKDMVRQNLKMIEQMPLSELYGQLSRSSEKFHDLPWDRLHEIEDIIQQSVRHSLESVEQMATDSGNSPEQQERVELLQKSLKQLNEGLSAKRAELEAAAGQIMEDLDQADLEAAKARAVEAQKRLAEVYEQAKASKSKAAEGLEKIHREMDAGKYQESLKKLQKLKQLARQEKDQAAQLRKEVAERVAIDHHEQELTKMRAEIDKLRAEIEALRAKRKE